jgi:hypothetical protein
LSAHVHVQKPHEEVWWQCAHDLAPLSGGWLTAGNATSLRLQ